MHQGQPVLQARLLSILHRAFVQARNLALARDCQQLYDLADTFEVLPELMAQWDEDTLDRIRAILAEYQASHPNSGYDYVSLLDMKEEDFRALQGVPALSPGPDTSIPS